MTTLRDDLGWLATGLGAVLLLAVVYPFVAREATSPLEMLVLPVLVVAAVGGGVATLVVGLAAMAATAVHAVTDPGLDLAGSLSRLAIVGVGTACGVLMAHVRGRREYQLSDATLTAGMLSAFERGLVPTIAPPPGLDVRTRYVPGTERLQLGGDFLDVVALPDDAAGFILGDVSGHGPRQASFAVSVRAGWRALASAAPEDPSAWLTWLEDAYFGDSPEVLVTALVGRIDLRARTVTLVSAGHPPPIRLGRRVETVPVEPEPLLGVGHGQLRRSVTVTLAEGERLFAYTDGLVEQHKPGRSRERWHERDLLGWLARHGSLDDGGLDTLLWDFGHGSFTDDVAMMLLSFPPRTGSGAGERHATAAQRSASPAT